MGKATSGVKYRLSSSEQRKVIFLLSDTSLPLLWTMTRQGRKLVSPFAGKIQYGDEVAFQVLGEKLKNLQCKGTSSWPAYCTQSTGPGMFMDSNDWGKYPSATFRIYRHRGKGAVRAGEVVAIYFPKQTKWMKCDSAWCQTNTCPGNPTTTHGMANEEKWHMPTECFQNLCSGERAWWITQDKWWNLAVYSAVWQMGFRDQF